MHGRVLSLLLALIAPAAFAADAVETPAEESPLGLSFVETKDVKLIYLDPTLTYLAPHAVRTFTNSIAWQRRIFGWVPYERTTVLLKDFADYGNASATAAPTNSLAFDIAPLSLAFETYPASERMYSLMNHELVHVSTMDTWTEQDRRWRRFFGGKVSAMAENPETLLYTYLTVPRFTGPRWYGEGLAVFLETWMGGGLGRAQGGYDEMVFRAMVRDSATFYDPLALVAVGTRVDFQVGVNAYLYGTRFVTWLAYAYTPEHVIAWARRDEGSKRYYSDQFQHVFGIPLERAWQDWIAFERDFQKRNLAEVRKHPITPHRNLLPAAVGSVSRAYYDESSGILYGGFRYPGVLEHIGALNTRDGTVKRLADVKGAMLYKVTSFAFDPGTKTAFYTTDNYAYRDVMALDVATGEERRLLEDARIGDLVFNRADKSLWGVRHANGVATLVRIPHPYEEWNQIHTFPYGVVPYDLDISPDGRLLSASMAEVNGDQFVRVWEIEKVLAGNVKPMSQFEFGQSVPESFAFSPDGRYLYGSSYFTGVSNIFRYEVANGQIEAVSNAESGYFRPVPLADGTLVIFNYTGAGFVPAVITPTVVKDVSAIKFLGAELVAKHQSVKTWQVPPPSNVDYDAIVVSQGVYAPLRNIEFQSAYPVLQGYKNSIGLGYHFNFEDRLRLAAIGVTAAYTQEDDPNKRDERGHLAVKYRYLGWNASVSWNRSDFYDMFGPTKRSRRGTAATLGYDHSIIFDEPRKLDVKSEVAFYDKLDALPDFQNVGTTVDRLVTAQVGLYYTHVRKSLGGVDDEKGVVWDVVASANHAVGKTSPQLRGDFDFGFPVFSHSSVWLRTAAGVSGGDRGDPLATYYFGGFGNNYVDSRSIKRYREYYALPGFGLNEIGGHSFARTLGEWHVPPVLFESIGTPSFYLTWLRPSLFAAALWTDPERSELRKRYASLGTQMDLQFTILHWYNMTLSFGYAVGYTGQKRSGDEWMISLKIM
jgi:hypothetical protein